MEENREKIKDSHIRESIKREMARSVVVEASAGTGKTTLLTDRVCFMVENGVSLENLAVVTFTEAAASELRARIREKIPAESKRKMDQAWIHTIHGFASRLLREYYHLCNGAPEFSTETSHFCRSEMEVLWDLYLAGSDIDSLEESSEALRYPGSAVLLDAAGEMEKHRWLSHSGLLGDLASVENETIERWKAHFGKLENVCSDKSDRLCLQIGKARESLERGSTEITFNLRGGSNSAWGGKERKKEVTEAIKEFRNDLDNVKSYKLMAPVIPALDRLIFPFLNRIRYLWDSDPTRLSFDDLLYRAGKAVEESSALRSELSNKFSYVFIDEFQDTSLIQVKLFTSMLELAGMKHKLTVVGDPKQSIYGWRSADIETYKKTVNDLEAKGALSETITVNFRSAKSIIRFVNSFGKALFAQSSPEEKPFSSQYSPIEQAPGTGEGEGVFIHRLPEIKTKQKAEQYSAMQADKIADLIADPGSTAVLFRTKTHIDGLLKEFDHRGIPYRVEAGRDFHERQEVRDTASLLKYMLYPGDGKAETDTLRSVFFGINDKEITDWRRNGIASGNIDRALSILTLLRNRIRELPPVLFIRTLFRNTCLLESIRRSDFQSGRRLANMRFILEQAESTDDCSNLLETLEGKAPVSAEEPSAPPEKSGGAVTVSTIHGAKGLAWKHVILANPGTSFAGIRNAVLSDQSTGRLGLKLKNCQTADYPSLKKREEHRRTAEYRRLLYVAVTRPRERLDVFIQPASGEAVTPCGIIDAALTDSEHYTDILIEEIESDRGRNAFPLIPKPEAGGPFTDVVDVAFPDSDGDRERAMRLGTEVHRVMEFIDFTDPEEWLAANKDMLGCILEFPDEAISHVRNFFGTFDLSGAEVVGREYPILADGKQFYVDLLLERNGSLEAIDFKTDKGDPLERKKVYEEHQRLYRRHLEISSGMPVKTRLVFLHHRRIVEID